LTEPRQKLRSGLLKLMEREEVLLTPFEGSSIIVEIKEGNRNSTLTSLAGTMRARGMTEEASIRHYLQKTTQGAILRLMKRKLRNSARYQQIPAKSSGEEALPQDRQRKCRKAALHVW